MVASTCNVFVGAETGLLKGVDTTQRGFQNLNDIKNVDKIKDEIEIMCWADQQPYSKVCCGLKNRMLKVFNINTGIYEDVLKVDCGNGPFKGLSTLNGNFLTCVESGVVKVWNDSSATEKVEFTVGANVCRMRHNSFLPSQIATGGKENELKIWDLENTKRPIFLAKNVKRDFLDLRVPIWVTDIQFINEGQKIVTATGYHQIRLYDPKSSQKRPVIDLEFDEYPITSLAVANQENYAIVGNTHGRMALFDLRKKLMVHCYKGFAGSIRSIQCHPSLPQVASCGLDRFLRVHDIHTHKLIKKYYLKSRLNCLLFREEIIPEIKKEKDSITGIEKHAVDELNDDLWINMEQASDDENPTGTSTNGNSQRIKSVKKRKSKTVNKFNPQMKKKSRNVS